jgi:TRAP-type C4-dicarboxylate transport system permease small subunit
MQVNLLYVHLVLPVTFTLMTLFHIQHMIDDFKKLFLNKDKDKNPENGGE